MGRKELELSLINLLGDEGAASIAQKYYKKDFSDAENLGRVLAALGKTKEELVLAKSKAERNADSFKELHRRQEKELKSLAATEAPPNRYLSTLRALTGVVMSGTSPALVAVSEGGLGKTTTVLFELARLGLKEGDSYAFLSGFMTPLELYHKLYQYRNCKLIVLDDVLGCLDTHKGLAMMRQASWGQTSADGARIVEYHSTSNRLECPPRFEMKAGLILLTNHIPDGAVARAFLSRALYLELRFTDGEKMDAIRSIAANPYKKVPDGTRNAVVEWLMEGGRYITIRELNFRTLFKLFDLAFAFPDKWREFAPQITEPDEPKKAMMEIIEKKIPTHEALQRWYEETGLGRASFFNYKRTLLRNVNESLKSSQPPSV